MNQVVMRYPRKERPVMSRAARMPAAAEDVAQDHFIERDGEIFAGFHLIVDLWNGRGFDDQDLLEGTLRRMVEVAGATLLHIHLHRFSPNGGISGVAVLAESHISVHTWPERGYAAFDVFMCGDARPHEAIAVLRHAFEPDTLRVEEFRRGRDATAEGA